VLRSLTALLKRLLPARQRVRLRLAVLGLRAIPLRGSAVECPVCGGRFRRFLAFGEGPGRRRGAECPACHALERNRLMILYLTRQEPLTRARLKPDLVATSIPSSTVNRSSSPALVATSGAPRVLHLAPEPGLQKRLSRALGPAYRSADLEWPLADDRVDVQALPYPDVAFDLILCSHVLAHVEDDRRALAQLRRVLDPNGALLLQAQIFDELPETREAPAGASPPERARLLGHATRYRQYGRDFTDRLREAGFDAQVLDIAATFSSEDRRRFGLGGEHPQHPGLIYRCTRR
jgi:SAM-dependent methyltransferase